MHAGFLITLATAVDLQYEQLQAELGRVSGQ